jgi:hypothetical protein
MEYMRIKGSHTPPFEQYMFTFYGVDIHQMVKIVFKHQTMSKLIDLDFNRKYLDGRYNKLG